MASKTICGALSLQFVSLSLLFVLSLADVPPSVTVDPSTACNSTTNPNFCKSVLPARATANLYDYGRFSVAKSLSNAQKFLNLVNRYLSRRSKLTTTAALALTDCQLLSSLNIDFLISTGATLNSTNYLLDPQAGKVQTLLSALLTNQQTCYDGLKATASAWSVKNGLASPISNSTKLYSVSLSFFDKAWVRNRKLKSHKTKSSLPRVPKRRSLLFYEIADVSRDGGLPLKMAAPKRKLFERWSRRTLIQETDSVLINDIAIVSQGGDGDFMSVSAAVAAAPDNLNGSTGYYLIYVDAGIYQEYVVIPKNKKYLMMIGDGINRTVITGNHNVADGWTTFSSATFAVVGQGFVGINMTIRNTAGAAKGQAVAVRNGGDLSVFYFCSFEGYQDAIYAHSMRQFYRSCDIYGTVDFIFGNAAALFQSCNIYARLPIRGQGNTITAQGRTDPNQNTGTSFQGCNFRAAPDLAAAAKNGSTVKTYLGRPWKLYSRTVIMESFMDKLIDPEGWSPWNGDALSTLYYAEYNNAGPGSSTANRVKWPGYHVIGSSDASNFTVSSFLLGDNWIPDSGVPYDSGLL